MYSPCIHNEDIGKTAKLCRDDSSCSKDIAKYAASNVPQTMRMVTPIGIAKDGRVIYGPYNSLGELW